MIAFAQSWSRAAGEQRTPLGTQEELDASSNVVSIITRRVLHVRLPRRQKRRAATGFHYAFAALLGAGYGLLAEVAPQATVAAGVPFGAAEWLLGNKLTAPRLGVLKSRDNYSSEERLQSFAAHAVYGVTTELVRRRLRRRF